MSATITASPHAQTHTGSPHRSDHGEPASTRAHLPSSWPEALPEPESLGFGRYLGPWIAFASHERESGWSRPEVLPRAAAQLELASGALQYGLSVFEGLKAFRDPRGDTSLFRADAHIRRLQRSAIQLAMPEPPADLVMALLRRAVEIHRHWVPPHGRGSLYLRPTLYACEEALGLRAATRHGLAVIVTPCSVPDSLPKRLWAERDWVRAGPGGLGAVKTGANYAASRYAAEQARARGYEDVLWLDAAHRRFISEAGTMNLFVIRNGVLYTPPLDGTLLAGITRDTLLRLQRDAGGEVREAPIALDDLLDWQGQGASLEIFGSGTAARIAPITEIAWSNGSVKASGQELTLQFSEQLAALQEGRIGDRFGWTQSLGI